LNAPYSLVLAERGALVKHLFVVMEKSPELAQMILPRSVAKLLHHRLSSEFAGLQDKSTLLQPRQNETIKYK